MGKWQGEMRKERWGPHGTIMILKEDFIEWLMPAWIWSVSRGYSDGGDYLWESMRGAIEPGESTLGMAICKNLT